MTRWITSCAVRAGALGRAACSGDNRVALTRWLFLRLLGAVYLIAFVSLWTQLDGLIGSRGILPAAQFLDAVRGSREPLEAVRLVPTLAWLSPGDLTLHLLCGAGTAMALLLLAGIAPAAMLAGLWLSYLSLTAVGQSFLSFQWDILLLEAGFLAVFAAPPAWRSRAGRDAPPAAAVVWLFRWLVFRLMFSSGAVKLLSQDPVWRDLTALTYHYQTQPLPVWVSWHAHHLPDWFQVATCALVFVIELAVPWLVFGPRRARFAAGAVFAGFQALIAATGNYTFFNLLTAILCLWLLDDAAWPAALRRRLGPIEEARPRGRWPSWLLGPVAASLALLSWAPVSHLIPPLAGRPAWLSGIHRTLGPLRLANSYGLFAVMTTTRPEIIVEGSSDGEVWLPYEFAYKPGELTERPRFVAPHQPRLDWQMWFAALGSYRNHPWFLRFAQRLLQGSPDVLALLELNPFPEAPPRYIRGVLYEYRFSDPDTKRATGAWWERRRLGLYCPILTLPDTSSP
ncbi:MAG TPA: lipase maturation factor family protein [bacterium]